MSLPKSTDLILVAVMPNPRDMEIARLLGWYRVPLLTAPKVIGVDYLAFFQPSSFGERKWCIETIAQVRGHELVTRAELLQNEINHPKAHEEYYKIQLGQLTPLSPPIWARNWKRITFFYTTGAYLLKAETINDLVVQSDERKLLWLALRERSNQTQTYGFEDVPKTEIDLDVLTRLLGIDELPADYET